MPNRDRLTKDPPLLDVERALRLVGDVKAYLSAELPRDAQLSRRLVRRTSRAMVDATLVALDVAIDSGDPRVLAAAFDVVGGAEVAEGYGLEHDFASVAEHVLPEMAEVTNRVRECARSPSALLRAATARGLGARAQRALAAEGDAVDAEALGIVTLLSKDEDGAVRAAARDALGGMALPAWSTFFPVDPLASRSVDEATRLRGPIEAAARSFDGGQWVDSAPLADALAALPDELARPFLDAWLRTAGRGPRADELVARWVRIEGVDGLARWMGAKGDALASFARSSEIGKAVAALGAERALETCVGLAAATLTLAGDAAYTRARNIFDVGWPVDADPSPLLEVVFGAPLSRLAQGSAAAPPSPAQRTDEDDDDTRDDDDPVDEGPVDDVFGVRAAITEIALRAAAAFPALVEVLIEARRAGYPGGWSRHGARIDRALEGTPHPRLRAEAERALAGGDAERAVQALRYLVGAGHDPSRDPAPAEIVRRAAASPQLLRAMFGAADLTALASDTFLAALVAPERTSGEVIELAGTLLASRARRRGVKVDDAAWAAVRRARGGARERREVLQVARLLPPAGVWSDEDDAFYDRFVDTFASDEQVLRLLAIGAAVSPHRALARVCRRIVSKLEGEARETAEDAVDACEKADE